MLIDPFTRRPSTYTTADAHFCKPFQFVCHQFVIAFDKPSHYSTAIDRVLHIYSHMSLDEFVCIVDCIVCSFVRSFAPLVGHWPMCNMIFLINTKASPCHLATIDSLSLSLLFSHSIFIHSSISNGLICVQSGRLRSHSHRWWNIQLR